MLSDVKEREKKVITLEPKSETPKTSDKIKNAATISWLQQCVHRSRNEVFTEIKMITPQFAEVLLSQNPDNRGLRHSKLVQMVADMRAGRWAFNGEPIIIAKTGELNDGQHRLHALIKAGMPQQMLLVFGVERETRTTIDQGAARSAGDYLRMQGVQYGQAMASVARTIIAYERSGRQSLGRAGDVSAAEVMDRALTDKTLQTSAKYGQNNQYRMKRYLPVSIVGFLHNILLQKDVHDGLAFMEALTTGEHLTRTDAVFKARERLLAMEHGGPVMRTEIVLRAWNAYRDKRTMRAIPVLGRLPELV